MQGERTVHKQLIDENRQFHRESIETAAKIISSVNRQYYSVAIIGVQNSGKSTLLNFLFGTNFLVLHEMAGTRTTRGIWVSIDKKENLLVFDVEGNDSMDRAEEQDYQKMVATYALVTANVLIINVWSKTIGQYNGTQYETLKVIMDICISQFKHDSPKTILFCVRDFNHQYDNEAETARKIVKDVNDIWRKIEKPPELQAYNQKPQKFFTIQVSVLRKYKEAKPQAFLEDVAKLREKFVNTKSNGYVFAKQKTQYNLPIKDLPQLTENAWNSIKQNKKLNLPNQKDQLASFRCTQIMAQVEQQFKKEMTELNTNNLITDFGALKQKYLEAYNKETYHYGKKIADQKASELVQGITDSIKKAISERLNTKTNELLKQFKEESNNFTSQSQLSLEEQMKKILDIKVHDLITYLKKMNFQVADRKERIQELTKNIKQSMRQIKEKILKQNQDKFQKESSRTTRLLSSQLIKNNFGKQFWSQARKSVDVKSTQLLDNFRRRFSWATGQELDPVEYGNMEQQIRVQTKEFIKSELEKSLQAKILDQFKTKFNKDEHGGQINFNLKTEQQISQHFDKTRQDIIDTISKMNEYAQAPRRSSIIETQQQNSLFESTWLSNTTQQIDKQMIAEFEKTIRRKKQSQMNEVPWWMFLLIFYFLYDDIWFTEEESPIIHYTFVVVLLVLGTLFAIGQGKVVKEGIRIATDKLKEKFAFLR